MATTTQPAGWLRRALRGALSGAVCAGLGAVIVTLPSGGGFKDIWPTALIAAGLGALIVSIGRGISGHILAAVFVGLVGLSAGAFFGERLLGIHRYEVLAAAFSLGARGRLFRPGAAGMRGAWLKWEPKPLVGA